MNGDGNVLSLRQSRPKLDDVVLSLRNLADMVERGEIGFPVTTAVVLFGHVDSEVPVPGTTTLAPQAHWQTFGYGPRTDTFTVRGLMASALRDWDGDRDD